MVQTASSKWTEEPTGDPMQDLIEAKKYLDRLAEEETWERDFWVSKEEKKFLTETPRGISIIHGLEMLYGYKINVVCPEDYMIFHDMWPRIELPKLFSDKYFRAITKLEVK